MPTITREALERIGVKLDPERFEQLVIEAVEGMPATTPGDPARDLTSEEAATLERGGFDLRPLSPDELADDPLARGAAEYAALVATALTPSEAATRLGVDPSRVRHRLAERTLFGIKVSGAWRLPLFQFDPATGRELPGIGKVLAASDRGLDPVSIKRWLETPDPDLVVHGSAVSPSDWLRRGGDPGAVPPLVNIV